ncbi:MAG: transketolase family protein [Candidatus Riflemargulisbacteria bacterium]
MSDVAATRDYYAKALIALGKKNKNVVVLDADLSGSTRTEKFAKEFPDRFFNAGIAEQDCIGMSAGLACMGKTVFASSFAMFLTGRTWEQIRNSVCYPKLNVKICATHAGITVGEDGASHQALEDIALMRILPNMRVIVPADALEAEQVIHYVAEQPGPFYVRMSRGVTPLVYKEGECDFQLGKNKVLKEGTDLTIMACGIMVKIALEAAEVLKNEHNISAAVVNVASIKPIDEDNICKMASLTGAFVAAEEHTIYGGMGSAVAEVTAKKCPIPIEMLGVMGVFGESGKPDDLLEKHSLNVAGIVAKALAVKSRK